jgi:hypothetical protein
MVVVVTATGANRSIYVNNSPLALTGNTSSPDGTGGGMTIGMLNNAGTFSLPFGGRVYAAMAMDRPATPAEVAIITSTFQAAFQ